MTSKDQNAYDKPADPPLTPAEERIDVELGTGLGADAPDHGGEDRCIDCGERHNHLVAGLCAACRGY